MCEHIKMQEKLIKSVQNYEYLYKPSHKSYKDIRKRELAWEAMISHRIYWLLTYYNVNRGGGGAGGSLITIHKEKKHLFTFHVENKLNSHFTWN